MPICCKVPLCCHARVAPAGMRVLRRTLRVVHCYTANSSAKKSDDDNAESLKYFNALHASCIVAESLKYFKIFQISNFSASRLRGWLKQKDIFF
jgi:hypothetical protein